MNRKPSNLASLKIIFCKVRNKRREQTDKHILLIKVRNRKEGKETPTGRNAKRSEAREPVLLVGIIKVRNSRET